MMFGIRHSRKPIHFFFLSLGVIPNETDALDLLLICDKILIQIANCNDDDKFIAYLCSIL